MGRGLEGGANRGLLMDKKIPQSAKANCGIECGYRPLVEVTGFEPAAFWSRTKRATKLRYTSKLEPTWGFEPQTC